MSAPTNKNRCGIVFDKSNKYEKMEIEMQALEMFMQYLFLVL